MGFEYRATFAPPLADTIRDLLTQRLQKETTWEPVGTDGVLAFRLSGRPTNDKWPEDFRLVLEPAQLTVTFHSSLSERHAFPRIREALKEQGVAANFEEV
jgi:hypothetical protein